MILAIYPFFPIVVGVMKAERILETVLYAEDLRAAERFYSDVLGMKLVDKSEVLLGYRMPSGMLLIFNPKESGQAGRAIPAHGMEGEGHVAFAASSSQLSEWKRRFERLGIEIEKIHEWEAGGYSVYVRDPAGNSVEFAPSTLWGGGWDF